MERLVHAQSNPMMRLFSWMIRLGFGFQRYGQRLESFQEMGGLGIIIIDYLQLITGSKRENRQQIVSEISRELKILAKDLRVPVIALSQLRVGCRDRTSVQCCQICENLVRLSKMQTL